MRYWSFLKQSARMALPMKHDFNGLGSAILRIGEFASVVAARIFILLTFPVIAPLVAYLWMKAEEKSIDRFDKDHKELVDSLMVMTQKNSNKDA